MAFNSALFSGAGRNVGRVAGRVVNAQNPRIPTSSGSGNPPPNNGRIAGQNPPGSFTSGAAGGGSGGGSGGSGDPSALEGDALFDRLSRSIIEQESGGNYRAVNPHSGALGIGQVMPQNLYSNWGGGAARSNSGWDYDALGRDVSSEEFLNSPEIQNQILNHRMGQYWREAMERTGGNRDLAVRQVASQWYSGRPEQYDNAAPESYNGGSYPSIREYTMSILNRFNNLQ